MGAIEKLGWPLDRIIHAEIWATDTIPADLPPMVEFKKKADKIIKDRWGIDVEHVYARRSDGTKNTYERIFYQTKVQGKYPGNIRGFATRLNPWCTTELKKDAVRCAERSIDQSYSSVSYVGIASDEPKRLARLDGVTKISPLAAIGWDEATCKAWCEENDLLSPLYTSSVRGGVGSVTIKESRTFAC